MANTTVTKLSAKHYKALELLEEGTLSVKEIAESIGWSDWTLYKLMSGNTQNMGEVAALFHSELKKQHSRNVTKVQHLIKDNQRLSMIKLNERLRILKAKTPTKTVVDEVIKINNSLGKLKSNVEINSTSYSFTKGMTAEELVHEFKRLGTLARSALDGGGVSSPRAQRSGTISVSDGRGSEIPESP